MITVRIELKFVNNNIIYTAIEYAYKTKLHT